MPKAAAKESTKMEAYKSVHTYIHTSEHVYVYVYKTKHIQTPCIANSGVGGCLNAA